MRNTEDRIRAAHLGAKKYRVQRQKRKLQLVAAGTTMLSLCLIVCMATLISPLMVQGDGGTTTPGLYASIFANSSALCYIIIGILSFILGVLVTVLCVLLRRKEEGQGHDD